MAESSPPVPPRLLARALDRVERIGNKLPDPLTLFVILMVIVPVASWIAAEYGWTVAHPDPSRGGEPVTAVNLLAIENLRRMFTEAVKNFIEFPPLGLVLTAMIGVGLAERSGLIGAVLKMTVLSMPRGLLSMAVVFVGLMSHVAADAGYVVIVPLGAVVFAAVGRHPLAGLAAAFAGVAGGFSATLLITTLDPLLAPLTEQGARLIEPGYEMAVTANWYFMAASTPMLTLIGWFVTDKIVEPRLGVWSPPEGLSQGAGSPAAVTDLEKRAVWLAAGAFLLLVVAVAALSVPEQSLFRDEKGSLKPLEQSLIPLMLLAFFIPGLVYGSVTGTIRDDRTVARMTAETMNTMGVYIVLAFVAGQFIAYFKWSNLGTMMAISGADLLKSADVHPLLLILGFILLSAGLDLFLGSASAKWAVMAPVFVPMFMQVGLSPPATQAAYRIGDSVVNIITPLMPYFPLVVAFARKYDKDLGLGTLISAMLPYSVTFLIAWCLLLIVWWAADLPLGPDAYFRYVTPGPAPTP